MGLISPSYKRHFVYFDKVPRAQVIEKLWSFIFASGWAERESNEEDRKNSIVERLQYAFEIAQERGAGTYGEEPEKIKKQFSRQYTIGWDLGIWKNNQLELSENARKVFNGSMSLSEYITRFCVNLFQYIEGVGYVHPLYLVSTFATNNNKTELTKSDFLNILPNTSESERSIEEFSEHTQMFMNYLSVTDLFDKVKDGKAFKLVFKTEFSPKKVQEICNLEYEHAEQKSTQELFKNELEYSEYITKRIKDSYYYDLLGLNKDMAKQSKKIQIENPIYQKIYSGAPGTGKSYQLSKEAQEVFTEGDKYYFERITFHPNINYGQFVGVFKPFPSKNENSPITYKFIPGILLKQLENAYRNPDTNYLILIEEINRANVASVFGDTFQLLDRKNGESEYPISISEDILLRFYNEEFGILNQNSNLDESIKHKLETEGLFFPDNFFIWASMNGADQGVMPMDTAFKRRWEFKKFDVNDLGENGFEYFSDKQISFEKGEIPWNDLRMALNCKLLELKIPEDKLMGPYFLSRDVLEDPQKLTESFESKVLMYLFEDVVKLKRSAFFNLEEKNMQYSELVKRFKTSGIEAFVNLEMKIKLETENQDNNENSN